MIPKCQMVKKSEKIYFLYEKIKNMMKQQIYYPKSDTQIEVHTF